MLYQLGALKMQRATEAKGLMGLGGWKKRSLWIVLKVLETMMVVIMYHLHLSPWRKL